LAETTNRGFNCVTAALKVMEEPLPHSLVLGSSGKSTTKEARFTIHSDLLTGAALGETPKGTTQEAKRPASRWRWMRYG
jgi:hypothetical protein